MTVMPRHIVNPSNPNATEVTSICEIFSKNFFFPVEVKTSVINSNKEIPSQTGLPRGRKLKQHTYTVKIPTLPGDKTVVNLKFHELLLPRILKTQTMGINLFLNFILKTSHINSIMTVYTKIYFN